MVKAAFLLSHKCHYPILRHLLAYSQKGNKQKKLNAENNSLEGGNSDNIRLCVCVHYPQLQAYLTFLNNHLTIKNKHQVWERKNHIVFSKAFVIIGSCVKINVHV